MVIMGGIDVIEGDKLEILGRTYKLDLDHSLAGDFVVWADENSFMMIYATPNFDGMKGVPVQLDYEWCNIDTDSYEGEIDGYDHYKHIVKELIEKMLKNLPRCKCACEVDLESEPPIDVKGWEFDLCGHCHKIIGKGECGGKGERDVPVADVNCGRLDMKTIGDVEIKVGDNLDILGKTYVLHIEEELSGEHVVWIEENSFMRIYATPNFEIDGVPMQVDYDTYNIAIDGYYGKIRSYDHYKQIVKEMAEKLLTTLKKCECVLGEEVGMCVPIDIKGSNFYICTRCSGTIGKDEYGRKDILTKERVVEEVNGMFDRYFAEKAQELRLKNGDISPDQAFDLDDAIKKIAGMVMQWAAQNQDVRIEETKHKEL